MNLANWLRFVHILAALWLAAGAFAGPVIRAHVKRAETLRDKVQGLRLGWRLATVFSLPGGILVALVGFDLIVRLGYQLTQFWLLASTLLWLFAYGTAVFYHVPRMRRTLRAGEASLAAGAPTPEFKALTASKLPGILADVNALIIVIITLLMVLKP